jgi:hypothetical protein
MRETVNFIFALLAVLFYSAFFFASASDVRAEKDFSVYIWEFGTREGQKNETTRNVTQEFEGAFIRTQCCSVLERRNYDLLMSQRENEQAIMSMEGIDDDSADNLKKLKADAVVFGEVYDDVQSGEVKIIVAVQNFAGKSLISQSVRFSRGKLSDAASREESMKALAEKVCSALVEKKIVQHAKKAENAVAVSYSFSAYQASDIVKELGEHNMIVNTEKGVALTSSSSTPTMIVLQGFSYKDKIELQINLDFNGNFSQKIVLLDSEKDVISLKFERTVDYSEHNRLLSFGDHQKKLEYGGWKSGNDINNLKITIKDNRARFFLNDVFWGLQEITFDTIDKVTISGIKRDEDFIYSVSVTPLD